MTDSLGDESIILGSPTRVTAHCPRISTREFARIFCAATRWKPKMPPAESVANASRSRTRSSAGLLTSATSVSRSTTSQRNAERPGRTISIPNAEDRALKRAVLQVVQPFVDPWFLNRSLGFRNPGRSRDQCLALAGALAQKQGLWTWVAEDLRNAFDNVPVGRLIDALRCQILAEDMVQLILKQA